MFGCFRWSFLGRNPAETHEISSQWARILAVGDQPNKYIPNMVIWYDEGYDSGESKFFEFCLSFFQVKNWCEWLADTPEVQRGSFFWGVVPWGLGVMLLDACSSVDLPFLVRWLRAKWRAGCSRSCRINSRWRNMAIERKPRVLFNKINEDIEFVKFIYLSCQFHP